jgi:two-component system phosphate regulon response regulator OmpR
MSQPATILIVDDEPDVREVLQEYFAAHGFEVLVAADARAARALMQARRADVALIDVHMPGEDGLSLARHLREHYEGLGIVMLTSASTVVDRIVGLEVGADDYVSKPFDPRELLARIRSVLRRTTAPPIEYRSMKSSESAPAEAQRVRMGRCVLDLAAHRLIDQQGNEVPLTPLEFDLLKAFAEHPNEALSRERILNLSQQRDWDPFDRSVDLRVMRVRKKIEPDPQRPQYIRTIRNAGYVFVADGEQAP